MYQEAGSSAWNSVDQQLVGRAMGIWLEAVLMKKSNVWGIGGASWPAKDNGAVLCTSWLPGSRVGVAAQISIEVSR